MLFKKKAKQKRDWYFPFEAAKALGVGHITVLRWVGSGRMPSASNGQYLMIPRSFVERVLEGHKFAGGGDAL